MPTRRHQLAVGAVSCSLLLLQVSFTRLIGYKLFYHFVFLAIGLTLLGLGAAGTYVALSQRKASLDETLSTWLSALALMVPISFVLIGNPFPIAAEQVLAIKLIGRDAILYLVWASLFMVALNFVGGVVLTEIFTRHSAHMGRLYSTDLVGAAVGCLLSVALMKYLSPPVAFLAATPVAAAALVPFWGASGRDLPGRTRGQVLGVIGLVLSVAVAFGPEHLRNFENFRTKDGNRRITVTKHEWNHIIRTDHAGGQYILDGEASTAVTVWDQAQQVLPVVDPAYVVAGRPADVADVAIVGFGGGAQVSEARRAGARTITAIDINPAISRWVLGEDRPLNQGLFAAPNIRVVNDEARHALRSSEHKLDVIVMHAIDTYAATAGGAYSLTENFLYTKEAFLDFFAVLKDGGVASIQRWLFNPPRENMRLFVTALEALKQLGVQDPNQHIVMIAPLADYEVLRTGKARVWGYLLVSPTPFRTEQIQRMREHVGKMRWSVLYAPGGSEDTPFSRYINAPDRAEFRARYPYVISPVTDARPYLFQFYNPLHKTTYAATPDWADKDLYQSSSVLLLVALGVTVALTLGLIVLPLLWARHHGRRDGSGAATTITLRSVIFFACLGVGYMALEVPLTQLLSLYLGHPVYGFSVVLVALLLSSGAGSLLVEKIDLNRARVCWAIAGVLAALTAGIFPLVHATMSWPDAVRFPLALLVVGLCGLPMGFPLALGVRELGRSNKIDVAWAWGVNAAASVVGSCVVMIGMVYLGSHFALALGAACYAVAALTSRTRGSPAA